MHQRSCQVIHGLNDELSADLEEQITTDNTADTPGNDNSLNDIDMTNDESFPELKQGINLPKNDSGWQTANDYFKCALQFNDPITMRDVNSKIKLLNDVIIYITILQITLDITKRCLTKVWLLNIKIIL